MIRKRWPVLLLLGLLGAACAACEEPTRLPLDVATSTEAASAGYDPTADPFLDLQQTVSEATSSGRRILLEVGGEWCIWCHY